ncbi:MAG: hypothetical protein RSC06_13530 [Clostridia bacterium]
MGSIRGNDVQAMIKSISDRMAEVQNELMEVGESEQAMIVSQLNGLSTICLLACTHFDDFIRLLTDEECAMANEAAARIKNIDQRPE